MPGPGQPFSQVTAPEESPLGPPPAGAPGQDPNARVAAINAVTNAGQPQNLLQTDPEDFANSLSPSTGAVAERFRTLQAMLGQGLEDVPPLSMSQQIGLTLAAIANPQAAQDALRRRDEERGRRRQERRELNAKIFDFAAKSVEAEADMSIRSGLLRVEQEKLGIERDRIKASAATTDSENAKNRSLSDLYSARAERFRRSSTVLDPNSVQKITAPDGTRLTRVTVNTETGAQEVIFSPEKSFSEKVAQYKKDMSGILQYEVSTDEAIQAVREIEAAEEKAQPTLGELGGPSPMRAPGAATAPGASVTSTQSRPKVVTSTPSTQPDAGLRRRKEQMKQEGAVIKQLVDDGRITPEEATKRLNSRIDALGLRGEVM